MNCQLVQAAFAEGIDAGIGPDIRAISAVSTEFNVVEMGRVAVLVDKYQFGL